MSAEPESNAPNGDNAGDARDPSGFLSEIIGAPVTVKLNSGVVYKGAWYYGFWNKPWQTLILRGKESRVDKSAGLADTRDRHEQCHFAWKRAR